MRSGRALIEIEQSTKPRTSIDPAGGTVRAYAAEELIAELGSAFICADLRLTPEIRDDHASYLDHWLKVLKADKRAIFTAASHAQRAADYLHGLQPGADRSASTESEAA